MAENLIGMKAPMHKKAQKQLGDVPQENISSTNPFERERADIDDS